MKKGNKIKFSQLSQRYKFYEQTKMLQKIQLYLKKKKLF